MRNMSVRPRATQLDGLIYEALAELSYENIAANIRSAMADLGVQEKNVIN